MSTWFHPTSIKYGNFPRIYTRLLGNAKWAADLFIHQLSKVVSEDLF